MELRAGDAANRDTQRLEIESLALLLSWHDHGQNVLKYSVKKMLSSAS